MYMFNLLFDFTAKTGRFSEDKSGSVLKHSLHWLTLKSTISEPGDPEPSATNLFKHDDASNWDKLDETRTLLLRRSDNPGNIGIRIAQDPDDTTTLPANATVELAVSFGRPVIARPKQNRASPFEKDGAVQTTFTFPGRVKNSRDAGNNATAWFFHLVVRFVSTVTYSETWRRLSVCRVGTPADAWLGGPVRRDESRRGRQECLRHIAAKYVTVIPNGST